MFPVNHIRRLRKYSLRIYSDILVCSELGVIRYIGSMVASRSYPSLQRIWILP